MERYSVPQCWKMGQQGDYCHADAVAEDRMIYYPNQDVVNVEGVFTLFCPCDDDYACKQGKCTKY